MLPISTFKHPYSSILLGIRIACSYHAFQLGESMVKYTKNVDEKISIFKRDKYT
jgi:hypothetical protein